MKKKSRKNQIIITALALMVAVAGYISYTGSELGLQGKEEDQAEEVAYDLTEENIFTDTEDNSIEEQVEETEAGIAEETETGIAEETDVASGETIMGEINTGDEGETQDTLGTEGVLGDESAGEAVLTGTQADIVDYATEVKLEREQMRAKNKEVLLELINNSNLSEEQRQQAVDSMVAMTSVAERETSVESLLEAKGFQNVVVSILDDSCDVVVNLDGISEAQRAQIEDIVTRKAGVSAENIVITPYQ